MVCRPQIGDGIRVGDVVDSIQAEEGFVRSQRREPMAIPAAPTEGCDTRTGQARFPASARRPLCRARKRAAAHRRCSSGSRYVLFARRTSAVAPGPASGRRAEIRRFDRPRLRRPLEAPSSAEPLIAARTTRRTRPPGVATAEAHISPPYPRCRDRRDPSRSSCLALRPAARLVRRPASRPVSPARRHWRPAAAGALRGRDGYRGGTRPAGAADAAEEHADARKRGEHPRRRPTVWPPFSGPPSSTPLRSYRPNSVHVCAGFVPIVMT